MPSARLPGLTARAATGAGRTRTETRLPGSAPVPVALAGALLLACLYAAFAHGAVSPSADERVQVALAVVAAVAAAAWLCSGKLVLRAPAIVWTGLALLGAFAIWSGITLAWSVSPEQTWAACNRAITYVIVLTLAIAVGASHDRGPSLVAYGFLAVCLAVTAYGLGQKLLPGLHIAGLIDLNRTGPLPRLQEPLGYWNALALFVGMGIPIALALAVQRRRPAHIRLGALAAVVLMIETIAFTYSRGGVVALVCALAAVIALGGARLRSLMWLALACLASLAPVVIGLKSHQLTSSGVRFGARELAGGELAVVLGSCLLLLVLIGRRLIELEARVPVSPLRARRVARTLAGLTASLIVIALLAVALSSRGLGGTVSHAWRSFTVARPTGVYDPGRLLSADSENRWVW